MKASHLEARSVSKHVSSHADMIAQQWRMGDPSIDDIALQRKATRSGSVRLDGSVVRVALLQVTKIADVTHLLKPISLLFFFFFLVEFQIAIVISLCACVRVCVMLLNYCNACAPSNHLSFFFTAPSHLRTAFTAIGNPCDECFEALRPRLSVSHALTVSAPPSPFHLTLGPTLHLLHPDPRRTTQALLDSP